MGPSVNNNYNDDDIDDIFAQNDQKKQTKKKHASGMKLTPKKDILQIEQTENKNTLDDFLSSFNDDLNKKTVSNSDIMPKPKIKHKNKHKKDKKPKKAKKESTTTSDDFFDDW